MVCSEVLLLCCTSEVRFLRQTPYWNHEYISDKVAAFVCKRDLKCELINKARNFFAYCEALAVLITYQDVAMWLCGICSVPWFDCFGFTIPAKKTASFI